MNVSEKERFFAFVLAVAVFVSIVLVLLAGLEMSVIGAAFVFAIAIAYHYPRTGIWLFLIYMPFAGTISYAFVSINQTNDGYISYHDDYAIFHLAKDALYVPALIALFFKSKYLKHLRKKNLFLLLLLSLLLVVCLITLLAVNLQQQLLNRSESQLFFMGIIGLKSLIGYVPLVVCGYYLLDDRKDLVLLMRLQNLIAFICCTLCICQYLLLVNGVCAGNSNLPEIITDKASVLARCFVGGSLLYNPQSNLISLPGTFVAPWQWAWFLVANSFFTFAAKSIEPSRRWRLFIIITTIIVIVTAIISGQTTATILVPLITISLLILTENNPKNLPIKILIILFLVVLLSENLEIFTEQLNNALARWNYSPPQEFIGKQFQWVIKQGIQTFGSGLGTASSAARQLGEIKLIETFYPKLLYEIGWFGTLVFFLVFSSITTRSLWIYYHVKQIPLRRLALCLWLFILLISYNTFYYPLTVDPVAIYYWFFLGILLKLPEIDHVNHSQSEDY